MLLLHQRGCLGDRLIDALWTGAAFQDAAKALTVAVSRLRKALEPERGPGEAGTAARHASAGYELRLDVEQLDLHRFERLVADSRRRTRTRPHGCCVKPSRCGAVRRSRISLTSRSLRRRSPVSRNHVWRRWSTESTRTWRSVRATVWSGSSKGSLPSTSPRASAGSAPAGVVPLWSPSGSARVVSAYARRAGGGAGIEPGRRLGSSTRRSSAKTRASTSRGPKELGRCLRRPGTRAGPAGRRCRRRVCRSRTPLPARGGGRDRKEPARGGADGLRSDTRRAGADRSLLGSRGAPAYWPWTHLLRAYVRETDGDALGKQLGAGAAELVQIVPELGRRFPELASSAPQEPDGARSPVRRDRRVPPRRRGAAAARVGARRPARSRPTVPAPASLPGARARLDRILLLGAYRQVDPLPGEP